MSAIDPSTELREALRAVARRVVDDHCSSAQVRAGMGQPCRGDALWTAGVQAGWLGLEIPEQHGGAGAGFAEVAVVLDELGRSFAPGALATSMVLGVGAVLGAGSEAQKAALLPRLADGSLMITAALCDAFGRPDLVSGGVDVECIADEHRLTGQVNHVPDVMEADVAVVIGRVDDGRRLFLVDLSAQGVTVAPTPNADLTRNVGSIDLDGAVVGDGWLLGDASVTDAVVEWLLDRVSVAIAADASGGAARVVELSTHYAKDRVQFGRPIGSFQAVKHLCVAMFVASEAARAAAERAAADLPATPGQWSQWPSIAKSFCGDVYARVAADGVQVHGGIGFTWEHDMHLHLRRALLDQSLFGTSTWHRERLARRELLAVDRPASGQ